MPRLYTILGALCGQFLSGTTVCGASGDQYDLPDTMVLQDDDVDFRSEEAARAWRDGSIMYGEEWEARDIVLSGSIWQGHSATLGGTQALIRTIKQRAARLDQRLEVDSGSYINVSRLRRMDVRPVTLTGRTVLDCRLVWRAADPFWYADTVQDDIQVLTGDDQWTVDTGALTTVRLYPVITIEAPASASVSSVTLRNVTTGSQQFVYADPGLANGAVAVIDSGAGTVTRAGGNTIRYYSGSWLQLEPGINEIEYEGPAATVTITWRERWI